MDDNARLKLNQMIKANNVSDQTELIRELKHSHILRENINLLVLLRSQYKDEKELYDKAIQECSFLYSYYTDLFNKIRKDEIDLSILFEFLDVLKQIEEGILDQHDGSYKIGILLKKIYIDSALKKADKLKDTSEPAPMITPLIDISWKQFKLLNKA